MIGLDGIFKGGRRSSGRQDVADRNVLAITTFEDSFGWSLFRVRDGVK